MITVNQLTAIAVSLFLPWTGAWRADVDLDLDDSLVVPSGRVVLTIGENVLSGTVDARASGRFGNTAKVRIVGGGGGWDQDVEGQGFHSDSGVTSTMVRSATAAAAGEVLVEVAPPTVLGVDYVRLAGPAGRVLPPGDWYVTLQGITTVGPRVPIPFDPTSVSILTFDPLTNRAELASDTVVQPGTILVDDKFGTLTVRDVEQRFDDAGSKCSAWCSDATSTRFRAALAKFAREATRVDASRAYFYRVIAQNVDGRLVLQAVNPGSGAPDVAPISPWYGVPGFSAKIAPVGAIVLLMFAEGDVSTPRVVAFDGTPPLQVSCGLGTSPVALAAPQSAINAALAAAVASLLTTIPLMITGYSGLSDPQKAAFTGAMGAVATAMGVNASLVPSHLLFSE